MCSSPVLGCLWLARRLHAWVLHNMSVLALAVLLVAVVGHTLVQCSTTKGEIVLEVRHDWAPVGAQRFLDLVDAGFYTDIGLFRAVANFIVQFGIQSDRDMHLKWSGAESQIQDDPPFNTSLGPFKEGFVSYAGGGPNTRTTQLFICLNDSKFLGKAPWEVPFAHIIEGMNVVKSFYTGYGEMKPFGKGPDQGKIVTQGNAYLRSGFPLLDYILYCNRVGQLTPSTTYTIPFFFAAELLSILILALIFRRMTSRSGSIVFLNKKRP